MHRFVGWFIVCLGLWCAGTAGAATVVIVAKDRSEAFSEAADAVADQLRRGGIPASEIARLTPDEVASLHASGDATVRLWVSLGVDAFKMLLAHSHKITIIAGLIPRSSFERQLRESGKSDQHALSAVFLDQPHRRQLELVRLALPDARRVGVLWGPESEAQKTLLAASMAAHDLEIKSETMGQSGTAFPGLRELLSSVDVLLAVPDSTVFNSATLPSILLSAYRARIPVAAFSQNYVKAGALWSLHSTPAQNGAQLGALGRLVLQGGAVPPPQLAQEFTVTVNDHVARSLGLALDAKTLTEQLRRLEKRP